MSLRIAVVGAGHLGKIHARLLSGLDEVEVVAITDPSDAARTAAGEALRLPTYASHKQVVDKIDAAVIAAPTGLHAEIAEDLLGAGKHLLIEKPLTTRVEDADRLVRAAAARGCVLQVGHVERFNPAWTAADALTAQPKYIEATRATSFPGRCLDVGVVMDLMIHDIDLVLSLTGGELVDVQASGLSVISGHEDLAEARLTFDCGLVAQLKASRISLSASRQMQIFGSHGFAELDFAAPAATLVRPSEDVLTRRFELGAMGDPQLFREQLFAEHLVVETPELAPRNAILEELHDFVISIRSGSQPVVRGEAGARAVSVAQRVLRAIGARTWETGSTVRRGPFAKPATSPHRRAG
jgi:predicted dehydrogenase